MYLKKFAKVSNATKILFYASWRNKVVFIPLQSVLKKLIEINGTENQN